MDRVLCGMRWFRCLVYLDDVISFGKSIPEALARLEEVLARLGDFGLQLKAKKCSHKTKMTPYPPESDGLVERFNRTLLMMLAMFAVENQDNWYDLFLAVMMAYRSSVHESMGFSPYGLMFGEECTLPMDVWVMRYYSPAKKCKLDSAWVGPYLVVSLAGWALGIQRHPDSPIILVHCQDLKKIPRP